MKETLIVLSRSPYSGTLARAGLDTALAYAAFEQRVAVLFSGAGVLQLAPAQAPGAIGRKSLRRLIESMPLYDLEAVYADADALVAFGLATSELPDFATALEADAQRELVARQDHVLAF